MLNLLVLILLFATNRVHECVSFASVCVYVHLVLFHRSLLEGDLDDLDVVVVLTLDRGVYDMLPLLLFGLSVMNF